MQLFLSKYQFRKMWWNTEIQMNMLGRIIADKDIIKLIASTYNSSIAK